MPPGAIRRTVPPVECPWTLGRRVELVYGGGGWGATIKMECRSNGGVPPLHTRLLAVSTALINTCRGLQGVLRVSSMDVVSLACAVRAAGAFDVSSLLTSFSYVSIICCLFSENADGKKSGKIL